MEISKLSVSGFRNLENVVVGFEADWTVLFGENNSGKTNILDALYAALRINRTLRQGAFELHDYRLSSRTAMAGDSGIIDLWVTLSERSPKEWSPDLIADFTDVLSLDLVGAKTNSIGLRVKSTASGEGRDEDYEWGFVKSDGSSLGARKFITELNTLQRLRPFFRLGALRDAAKEFTNRSTFFAPFVNDPTFSDIIRTELTQTLATINATVLEAHEAFATLKDNIAAGAAVVIGDTDVQIEAVPSRLSELLAHTQVSMSAQGQPLLPVERHGSGSQSIAVLSLFNAYVASKLASRFDENSKAILTLEEPETHLHPSAIRALWKTLTALDAQLVLTTHSGDLLGEVPLRCIRRVHPTPTGVRVMKVDLERLTLAEQRNLEYGIQATRGELLFARGWLLVEGRTELMGLKGLAEVMGIDLHRHSVRIVECQQYGGPKPFARLADDLGIAWHCLCDGDTQGAKNETAARDELAGRPALDHITMYAVANIEALLCTLGFDDIYLQHLPSEIKAIPANPGTNDYANFIGSHVIPKRKERAIREVCLAVRANKAREPQLLRTVLETICRISNP